MFHFNTKRLFFYLKGILLGLAVTVICLIICAALLSTLPIDRAFAAPLATVCLAIGTVVAAWFAAYRDGEKGYIVGLAVGLIYFIIVTLAGMLIREGHFTKNTVFHLVILLLCGMIGGILGVNKKTKQKYI